jgi:hypothetical protein
MPLLNRSAILSPKQPFADWANSIDDDGPRFVLRDEDDALTVYLGPELDTVEEIRAFVDRHFDYFFEDWLNGWCTDPARWPRRRTRKMFNAWFEVRIHTMVDDMVEAPYELL